MDKKIEEKIQKLLVMSEQGTPEERKTAYKMLQKLMAKYHFEFEELRRKEEKINFYEIKTLNFYAQWKQDILGLIAKNFRCKTAFTQNGKNITMYLIGYEQDCTVAEKICKDAIQLAELEAKREINYIAYQNSLCKRKRDRKETKGVKSSYITGFYHGLIDGFEELRQINEPYAVALVIPQEVTNFVKEHCFPSDMNAYNKKTDFYDDIYENGVDRGRRFALNEERKEIE